MVGRTIPGMLVGLRGGVHSSAESIISYTGKSVIEPESVRLCSSCRSRGLVVDSSSPWVVVHCSSAIRVRLAGTILIGHSWVWSSNWSLFRSVLSSKISDFFFSIGYAGIRVDSIWEMGCVWVWNKALSGYIPTRKTARYPFPFASIRNIRRN